MAVRFVCSLLLSLILVSRWQEGVEGIQQISIDGAWSPWSNIETPCVSAYDNTTLVLCGGGMRKRYRSCTNPMKQGSGQDCVGESETTVPCNQHACQLPGDYLWSAWSACSVNCGRGLRKRYTMCGTLRDRLTVESLDSIVNNAGTSPKVISVDGEEFELEFESACVSNQVNQSFEECNTWQLQGCPSPCLKAKCPMFAKCIDTSNSTDASFNCSCELGMIMKEDRSSCINPPPTAPTPRPIPTLPPKQKVVANIMTRSASTLIVIFLSICLGIFLMLGIFDPSRVIHMNMEIALLLAHVCLLPSMQGRYMEEVELCRVISIFTNFFFLACFVFMFLESVYMYSIVAWVVYKDGLLTRTQNILVGWGLAFVIVLLDLCFEYDDFGGDYHCFLRLDTPLMYGIYVPIIVLVILTFAILEAAGAGGYARLNGEKEDLNPLVTGQRTTARIMQRTLLLILPLVFASYVLGSLAEFEQNIYLYSIFTLVNGVLGGLVLFFHCSANKRVREILGRAWKRMCPGKVKAGA